MHLPHLPVPLVMLSFVYASAIAVAHPGRPALGALVVLAGLTARRVARYRRAHVPAAIVVLTPPDAAPAPATAA